MSDFQNQINVYPQPGKAGKKASTAIPIPALSDQDGFIAATGGLTIARFCWRDTTNPKSLKNTGTGAPLAFVYDDGQGVNFNPLTSPASMVIPAGYPCSPMVGGDFWAVTTTAATIGQKVFAVLADGSIKTGTAGASVAGAAETEFYVATAGGANELIKISTFTKG